MAVAELATKISFVGSLKPLDKLNNGLDTAVKSIGVATVAFTTAGYAVHAFMQETLSLADAQGQLARETGVSVEAIQEWGYVASLNGSSAEAFQTSLEGLSKKIGETATQGSEDFNRLGISVRDSFGNVKSADVIMGELSNRFKQMNLSKEQQADFLEKLGIDRTMIQTLNLSSEALSGLRAEARALGVLSQQEVDQLIAYNDSVTTVRYGVDALQKKLAIALIPQMQQLSGNFIQLLKDNKGLISEGLNKFTEVLGIAFKAVFRFGKLIVDLFSNMTDGQKTLVKLTAGVYLFNKAFNMSPIGRIISLVTGLFLAIDDLSVGLQGGRSVIADWFKSWSGIDILPAIGSALTGVGNVFTWLGNTIAKTWEFIKPILDLMFEGIKNTIELATKISDTASSIGGSISSGFNTAVDTVSGLFDNDIKINQNSMLPKTAPSNTNNNMQQTNNVTFNIKSTDPIKVSEEIQKQMKNANAQFSTGGR